MNPTLEQVEARLLAAGYKITRRNQHEVAVSSEVRPYWDVAFLNIDGIVSPSYNNFKMTSVVPAMKAIVAGMSDPDHPEECPFCGCRPDKRLEATDGGPVP